MKVLAAWGVWAGVPDLRGGRAAVANAAYRTMLELTSISQLRISAGISDWRIRRARFLVDMVLCPACWRVLFRFFSIALAGYLWRRHTGSAASGLSSALVSLKMRARFFLLDALK